MSSAWGWIIQNKEWLFSGIAVAGIGYIASLIFGRKKSTDQDVRGKIEGSMNSSPAAVGHIVTQTVTYNLAGTNPAPIQEKEKKATSPRPRDILKAIDSLPPFQRASAAQNYTGLKICWFTEFSSIERILFAENEQENHSVYLKVRGNERWDFVLVCCDIDLNKYPELKILHADHPIWLKGKIIGLTGSDMIRVGEAELDILEPRKPE
jgi:hypothetical protein